MSHDNDCRDDVTPAFQTFTFSLLLVYGDRIVFINKFDVEFSTKIYVLRSPEPKEVVSKMPFCTYIVVVVWTHG